MKKGLFVTTYTFGQPVGECIFINEEEPVTKNDGRSKRRARFKCRCGYYFVRAIDDVRSGRTASCGCMSKQKIERRHTKSAEKNPENQTWKHCIDRCKPSHVARKTYYDRGIKVCDRWLDENGLKNFIEDMGLRPSPKHTLDRIENDKGYCKENCRWATVKEQARNKTNNLFITFNGKTQCVKDWTNELNFSKNLVYNRLKLGWSAERALTTIP